MVLKGVVVLKALTLVVVVRGLRKPDVGLIRLRLVSNAREQSVRADIEKEGWDVSIYTREGGEYDKGKSVAEVSRALFLCLMG